MFPDAFYLLRTLDKQSILGQSQSQHQRGARAELGDGIRLHRGCRKVSAAKMAGSKTGKAILHDTTAAAICIINHPVKQKTEPPDRIF